MKKSQKWKNKLKRLVMYGPKKKSKKDQAWKDVNNSHDEE